MCMCIFDKSIRDKNPSQASKLQTFMNKKKEKPKHAKTRIKQTKHKIKKKIKANLRQHQKKDIDTYKSISNFKNYALCKQSNHSPNVESHHKHKNKNKQHLQTIYQ